MIMFSLAAASLWSWTVAFDKILKFHVLRKRSDEFEDLFSGATTMDEILKKTKDSNSHPLAKMFLSCMQEWKSSNVKHLIAMHSSVDKSERKAALKERMHSSMQIALNRSVQRLEGGLNFLAIVGSSSPFVGLFGTVWGIMNSFQGIAISKNTSLSAVAPGIAEALMATAVGLFAAIPAVLFYNIFSAKINAFVERAEIFSTQLINALSKELER
jgi:biopolymer transport protein TolQ